MNVATEVVVALASAGVGAVVAVAVQLWRLAERLTRVDERLATSLRCCDELAEEQDRHREAMIRAGML